MQPRRYHCLKLQATLLQAVALGFCLLGCASPKMEKVWIPPSRVNWLDIGTKTIEPPHNNFVIFDDQQSEGRFPCSLAVSRMKALDTGDGQPERTLSIPATPRHDFLVWNSTFDDLLALSETFPVVNEDLGGYQASPPLVLSAARALGAGLCMIYAVNQSSPSNYEMMGVIYETATSKPIAAIHSKAQSIPPFEGEKRDSYNVDAWEFEARALALARFNALTRRCMRELIARDIAKKVDVPTGWKRKQPLHPTQWPPRDYEP